VLHHLKHWFAPSQHTYLHEQGVFKLNTLKSLLGLAMVVEARDPYTAGHLWRVSRLASLLAARGGLSAHDCACCEAGGFLHDLGKVAMPDSVLGKPAELTPDEFEVMQTHPSVGARVLGGHALGSMVYAAVRSHHERPDGTGYPDGLSKDDIPLTARVVGLVDAFDAMTSDRPYRKGMPIEQALSRIREGRGRQFDAAWVDVLLTRIQIDEMEHIVGHSEEGLPLLHCPVCSGPMLMPLNTETQVGCRICAAELEVHKVDGVVELHASGRKASADLLQPKPEPALIDAMATRLAPYVR